MKYPFLKPTTKFSGIHAFHEVELAPNHTSLKHHLHEHLTHGIRNAIVQGDRGTGNVLGFPTELEVLADWLEYLLNEQLESSLLELPLTEPGSLGNCLEEYVSTICKKSKWPTIPQNTRSTEMSRRTTTSVYTRTA